MTLSHWLHAAGGFGIFLFALQLLNQVLNRSITKQLRPLLNLLFETKPRCVLAGFLATILVQASSTTILAAGGLVNASLLSLEQGFFLMLGATVGTTVKAWFFAFQIGNLTPLLVLVGSFSLLFLYHPKWREGLEALLCIGLVFLGLDLLTFGLEPLKDSSTFLSILKGSSGSGFQSFFRSFFVGVFFAFLLQSSTAFLFLVFALASQGLLSFEVSALLLLGANVGTTGTALIGSLAFYREGRRIAVAHLVVKCFGALLFLPVFSYFLQFVDLLIPGDPKGSAIPFHLAAVHSFFNLFNLFLCSLLFPFFLRFLRWAMPSESDRYSTAFSPLVWRMIVSSPVHALQEAAHQFKRIKLFAKALTDTCVGLMLGEANARHNRTLRLSQVRDFEQIKEGLFFLYLRVSVAEIPEEKKTEIRKNLKDLAIYSNLFYEALTFYDHLERGMIVEGYRSLFDFTEFFKQFPKEINQLWLSILAGNLEARLQGEAVRKRLAELEDRFLQKLPETQQLDANELAWLYQTLHLLSHILYLVTDLVSIEHTPPAPDALTEAADHAKAEALS